MRFKITLALALAFLALGLRSLTAPTTHSDALPELPAVKVFPSLPVLAEAPPN